MTARYARGILAVAGLCTATILSAQAPLQIVTDTLPAASTGAAYNQQLVTTGGVCSTIGSASSTIDAGALPPGLSITSPAATKQWFLQGVPTTPGNFTFTVRLRWSHTRQTPFEQACDEDAVKALALTVQANQSLSADRSQLSTIYNTVQFAPPPDDKVVVSASGGAAVAITVQAFTDSGGPWLSVNTQRATTPASLVVSYQVRELALGTYTGRVVVTTDTQASSTIPVTLQVVTNPNVQLQATPSSLAFSIVTGSPDPPSQSIRVTVPGPNVLFNAIVSAAPPNGKWLSVKPTSGLTPATLDISVTAKDLGVGTYNGVLNLLVGGTPNGQFTVNVTFTIKPLPPPKPAITAGGVVNAAGLGNAIAPGTWVSLFGTSLASTARAWKDTDFQGGLLPTSLDGVSVTINGKSAAVAFISPLQINVLAADDTATGLVPVVVKNSLGASESALVLQQTAAPELFQLRSATASYVAGTHADGSYLAGPPLVQAGIPGTAARVGETIVLFGTGFGATQPPISATAFVPVPLPLARPQDLRIRIGGVDAGIEFAGLISPGVYQFNVVVPQLTEGDKTVVAELRGLLTQGDLLLTIQR